jgi:hypothetical protein
VVKLEAREVVQREILQEVPEQEPQVLYKEEMEEQAHQEQVQVEAEEPGL